MIGLLKKPIILILLLLFIFSYFFFMFHFFKDEPIVDKNCPSCTMPIAETRVGDDNPIPAGGSSPDPITQEFVDSFKARYNPANKPDFIVGGSISKCALTNILYSMDPADEYVEYRFGVDQSGKNTIIFRGGLINPDPQVTHPLGQELKYRMADNSDRFCPMFCDHWVE
ncbi:MAG: hypothetical protein IPK03_06355 [Bacteroidetes bacterium]|nr:hypothetical protein [Bacteroidota bacterium]